MRPGDFVQMVDPHYAGLVQRLALVLHDAEAGRDAAQDAYLRDRQRRLGALQRTADRAPAWVPHERVDLWAAIGELRPPERAALLLNVVDGYTQAEIAEMLEAPPGTVASWVASAKRRLRDSLGPSGGIAP